jgi:hypothetical protein
LLFAVKAKKIMAAGGRDFPRPFFSRLAWVKALRFLCLKRRPGSGHWNKKLNLGSKFNMVMVSIRYDNSGQGRWNPGKKN